MDEQDQADAAQENELNQRQWLEDLLTFSERMRDERIQFLDEARRMARQRDEWLRLPKPF